MTETLALPILFESVKARFEELGDPAPHLFGWRAPDGHKVTTTRVVWIPGDEGGNAGEVGSAKQPGRIPRPLGTYFERFHVRIEAAEPAKPEDELEAYKAVRELFKRWFSAVYLAARGTFTLVGTKWDRSRKLRRYGAALIVTCSIEGVLPEVESVETVETFARRALITSSSLDVDELISTGAFYLITEGGDALATEDGALVYEPAG